MIRTAATKVMAEASMAQEATPVATVPGAAPGPAESCGEEALAAFRARRKKERETEPEECRTDVNAYEAHLYRVLCKC
jgi:hypothetical protein